MTNEWFGKSSAASRNVSVLLHPVASRQLKEKSLKKNVSLNCSATLLEQLTIKAASARVRISAAPRYLFPAVPLELRLSIWLRATFPNSERPFSADNAQSEVKKRSSCHVATTSMVPLWLRAARSFCSLSGSAHSPSLVPPLCHYV